MVESSRWGAVTWCVGRLPHHPPTAIGRRSYPPVPALGPTNGRMQGSSEDRGQAGAEGREDAGQQALQAQADLGEVPHRDMARAEAGVTGGRRLRAAGARSEEHTSELQSREKLV